MRAVYSAENVFDAYLLRDRLREDGIEAVVHGEMLVGALGELPADTRPSVWIADEGNYERARTLVASFESETAEGADWTCRHCRETNGANFAICWHCGTARTGA